MPARFPRPLRSPRLPSAPALLGAAAAFLVAGFWGNLPRSARAAPEAPAAPLTWRSPTRQTPLLELFTSEGCSSCPPAEEWLGRLRSAPGLWRDFVPVAWHVDYWNHLGWRDVWSAPAFTARQHALARAGSANSVYTPGFFLDGQEWQGWFGRRDVGAPAGAGAAAGSLVVRLADRAAARLEVSFAPAAGPAARAPLEAHAAWLGFDLSRQVRSGENGGRTLHHDFTVLRWRHAPLAPAAGTGAGTLAAEITDRGGEAAAEGGALPVAPPPGQARGLAVWVTRAGDPRPLQAVGGWLVPPAEAAGNPGPDRPVLAGPR